MDSVIKDLKFAIRGLLKRPAFTVIALVALALGIGANTAIFSLVNAVMLRPLPFAEPDELVWVYGNVRDGVNRASVSPLDFLDYRNQNKTFEQFATSYSMALPATLTGGGDPDRLQASIISGNYLETFGVAPALGRGFTLDNEKPGQDQVTILSHALWQQRFGGDPSIINKTIVLNGRATEVIGVMGEGVSFPQAADLWLPMNLDADPSDKTRFSHMLRPVGRLKPGVSMAQAQADMDVIAAQLEQQFPESNQGWSLRLVPLREELVGGSRTMVLVLFGAVAFVLLIACANVANLLLVRAAARQKEIALRTALGASRWRIVRQMITEGLLLAIAGGALGAFLATWGVQLLVKLSENSIPPTVQVTIDATVLGFTLLVSVITGVLFGLAPAFRTADVNLIDALKEGMRGEGQSALRSRTRSALVILESAIAVVLLIGAGLLIRSLVALQNVNPGFDSQNVLTARVELSRFKYDNPDKAASFFQELETRISNLPGVEAAGMVSELPLSGQGNDMWYTVEGQPPVTRDQMPLADFRRVNQNYIRAMGIPLLRGRNFTEQEVRQTAKVIIVSKQLVQSAFPNEDALGKRLITGFKGEPYEIVGIAGDLLHQSLGAPPTPAMYFPMRQSGRMNLVVRTKGDPLSLAGALRNEVRAIDPDQPVSALRPMAEWVDSSVAQPRYRTTLLALFAALAMVLAATGIYGVMSYSVAQRTHEIGVRMALGAQRVDVLKLVVGQGMVLTLIGVGIGLLAAFGLTRVMESLLFGVTPKDPITFAVVAALLTTVAFLACFVPARRATKVDPLVALRYE
ncbi:MAG TPA: ABC transporter permease [Pyrinomonadaceae bacterium]|nr:ABC transporter permease [Pyrinomonadaceae bacterium]